MKRLILSIIVSLLCVLNTIFAVESNGDLVPKNYISSELALMSSIPTTKIKTYSTVKKDLTFNHPELSDSDEGETSVNYNIWTPPIKNTNKFYYKGSYVLNIDNKMMHILDSLVNTDSLYTLLNEAVSNNKATTLKKLEYIDNIVESIPIITKKFQEEKRLEAKANLVWPLTAIISLIFIATYRNEDNSDLTHYLKIILIAAMIGTFITLPEIIVLLKGIDYSVLNRLGN